MLKKTIWVAVVSSLVFLGLGYGVGYLFGYTSIECLIIGLSMMFSSTIIGLKLLPSTTLHHQRIGEVMISILLLQDLIAILVMLFLHGMTTAQPYWKDISFTLLALPSLLVIAFIGERYILQPLLSHFNRVQEYVTQQRL